MSLVESLGGMKEHRENIRILRRIAADFMEELSTSKAMHRKIMIQSNIRALELAIEALETQVLA